MNIVMGPILGFRGLSNGQWLASALVVVEDEGALDSLVCSAGSIELDSCNNPVELHQFGGRRVVRYDVTVAQTGQEQEIQYTIGQSHKGAFFVPAKGSSPRMAYASCNGFANPREMKKVADKNERWSDLAAKHGETPFHLLLLGGDQVYSDSIWEVVKPVKDWVELPRDERVAAPVPEDLEDAVRKFYFELYCQRWKQAEPAEMFASIPTVMMWDDHDIFDGWGSHREEENTSPVFQAIFRIATEHFRVFQLGVALNETPPGWLVNQGGLSYAHSIGKVAIAVLDMRSERTPTAVLGEASWNAFLNWMDGLGDGCKHLLLMSSIPVVHPDFSTVERFLGIFPGEQEIEDDLKDHWHSRGHKNERLRLIHRLLEFSALKGIRVTMLSGDVHIGAVGVIESDRGTNGAKNTNVINQLTSSAIVHPPPPGMFLFALEHLCKQTETVDRGISARMMELPGAEHRYIGARNWLSLDVEDDGKERVWANWHVEGEDGATYTKVIHACA